MSAEHMWLVGTFGGALTAFLAMTVGTCDAAKGPRRKRGEQVPPPRDDTVQTPVDDSNPYRIER